MDNFETNQYSAQLRKDLMLFERWQVLVDALGTMTEPTELLDILQKMLAFKLR